MRWLLDSNACIRYLEGRSRQLRSRIDATDPNDLCVSAIVKAELYFGAELSRDPVETKKSQASFFVRFRTLAFDDFSAGTYAAIRADLTKRGQLIGPNDLLIAATCIANAVTLVTHNTGEFERVKGLSIEDWEL
jgi:tRNA(fMet)-specific endonuclease VapC